MCRTFLDPKTCGFAKVAAPQAAKSARMIQREERESSTEFRARCMQERFKMFRDTFSSSGESFEIDFSQFNLKLAALQSAVSKWSPRKKDAKKHYLAKFSVESWKILSEARQREHTLFDCKGCHQHYPAVQALFPLRSPRLQHRAKENPFVETRKLGKRLTTKLLNKTQIKDTAKTLYDSLNPLFESVSGGISFAEALTKVPEANLEIKKSNAEKKAVRRRILREVKENIEEQWRDTSLIR